MLSYARKQIIHNKYFPNFNQPPVLHGNCIQQIKRYKYSPSFSISTHVADSPNRIMPNKICRFLGIGTIQGTPSKKHTGRQLGSQLALMVTENDKFNDISSYMEISNLDKTTTNYLTVMALGGPYGADRSNSLFKTRFPTGDPLDFNTSRMNGYWICLTDEMKMHSKSEHRKFLVLYSRGSFLIDSQADAEFAKKTLTFGIRTADVILILKEISSATRELTDLFKAKVSLAQEMKERDGSVPRKTLLFVIYYKYQSLTASFVRNELHRIWNGCIRNKLMADYFDFDLHLINKVKETELTRVRDHLMSNTVLDVDIPGKVPLDKWSEYARECWNDVVGHGKLLTDVPPRYQ